ncbi:hypothetical protein VKT23_019179 [Stygiomarasmius scandens]|uniref:Uncharacterized protein n=1 Tax=Marasmiellus scandens TaxID=2682957 RepID=A0ABR1IR18_9AGAR
MLTSAIPETVDVVAWDERVGQFGCDGLRGNGYQMKGYMGCEERRVQRRLPTQQKKLDAIKQVTNGNFSSPEVDAILDWKNVITSNFQLQLVKTELPVQIHNLKPFRTQDRNLVFRKIKSTMRIRRGICCRAKRAIINLASKEKEKNDAHPSFLFSPSMQRPDAEKVHVLAKDEGTGASMW